MLAFFWLLSLEIKCVFPVLYSQWDFFFLNHKKPHLLIYSYISQAQRFKIPICGLSVSRKGQLRVLRLSTGKEKNFTWWEVEE